MEDILGISIIRDPGTQTNFDLLAIHGINGHPYHTWTHPNGAKWLEDYLPEDMPNARIMTFGYNSQIFTSSKGFVTDFAEQLLQHLMSIRRSTDSTNRPIIFLCHSLGGLVVKKALTLAQEAHDAAAVRKSTILVAFMGTPHRGSQLASYAEIAVTCIKTTGFKANTANIHHLKLDSDALEELGSQFGSLLQMENIKVLTFYELRPIKLAGIAEVIVVPKWSAKLGLGPPLETIIPVDADHRQIAQFTGRSSKQYEVFRSNIVFASSPYAQMTQTNECLSKDRKWKQIILWLGGLRCQPGPALRKECVEGTCKWIYEKQKFQNWRGSKRPAGLWIYGKPGVGKTVLSSYISHLLRSEDGNLVITLYCHLYRSLNEPLYALLRDILLQALQLPYLSTIVKQRLLDLESQISALSDISFDTLLEIVDKMLYSTSKLVLIVDGIDELEQEAANLEYILHKIHTISQSGGLCKILIVSRNTSTLERLLGSWQMMAISSVDSLHDISIFLHRKLRHMSHLGDRRDEVIERLVDGSKGLFLWADLAVSEIDHLRTWNEVQALLESGNCGLDAIYATVIKQLDTSSKGLCRIRARALPLVSIAYRPLRLEEIQELLAVEVSKGFVEPGNRILGGWSTLSRACGPFLEINELGTVELIRVSAKEFLMTHQWAGSLAQEHLIDGSAEIEMTCLCLTYLSFNDFGRTREDIKLDIDSLNQKYPMLEYASQFWPVHFLRSEKITTLQLVLLDKFLNCQCSAIWATMFYPYFSIRHGETIETTLTIQHSILANLERNLRTCGNDDLGLSNRCIEKCRRLLLDSTRNSLVMEKFHSGPAAKVTLKKSLRFAKCCCALNELEAAKEVASEALKIAEETFGRMQPLTLQLQRMKLYIRTRIQHKSPTLDSYNVIPDFVILVKTHIKGIWS
ncbi:hypothetical protein B0O99DRAFT_287380 [Bisporella sp. PMI_857]|nr:hypothetical protein B0O99DRAFT_287380 [Bisporella sp. PMI_857]